MPIYEYTCEKCHEKFEKLVRSSTDGKPECPKCGSAKTARTLSVFAAVGGGDSSSSSSSSGGHVHSGMCGCGKRAGSCGM
jgi:putative FmdB family regulatory protein